MSGMSPAVEAAAGDRTSGAAEVTRAAALALLDVDTEYLDRALAVLLDGQPAMASIWRLATAVLSERDHRKATRAFLRALDRDADAAPHVASVLPDRVLTISRSSQVSSAIRLRAPRETRCMESLPGGEGAAMAADLADLGRGVEVVGDEEALQSVPAEAVLVGTDAVNPVTLVNKVGTRRLAEAARRAGIPCYAVAGETKFAAERLPIPQAFEAVPLDLFSAIATPGGMLSPAEAGRLALLRPIHPALHPRLRAAW